MIHPKRVVFAYIRQYRCLDSVGLNFDPRFKIQYDEVEKVLSIETLSLPEEFYPKGIACASVIAGKNGAGKSSSLRWILERVIEGSAIEKLDGIMVFVEDGKLKIYHDVEIKEIKSDRGTPNIEKIDTSTIDSAKLQSQLAISTIFDSGHFKAYTSLNVVDGELGGERNISDSYLLVGDIQNYKNDFASSLDHSIGEHLLSYSIQNDLRICELLLDSNFHKTLYTDGRPQIHLPMYIRFIPNSSGDRNITSKIEFLKNQLKRLEPNDKEWGKVNGQLRFLQSVRTVACNTDMRTFKDNDKEQVNLSRFIHCALLNFYFNLAKLDSVTDDVKEYALNIFTKNYSLASCCFGNWVDKVKRSLRHKLRTAINNNDIQKRNSFDVLYKFFQELRQSMEFLDMLYWLNNIPHIHCIETIKPTTFKPRTKPLLYAEKAVGIHYKNKKLDDLMRSQYFVTERFFDLNFAHDLSDTYSQLSSGEYGLLNLFSRLKYAFETPMPGGTHKAPSLILLDEVEISFHPEWQRRFITWLFQFLSLLSKGEKQFQIIYTTHSPITLSDMPAESVNLLSTDGSYTHNVPNEGIKPFGANVFDLYGQSFFMENGLIGEFASQHIKTLSADIEAFNQGKFPKNKTSEITYRELVARIEMIGDSRIKAYLYSRLEHDNPQLEIIRLRERLKQLEKDNQR